jgi:hypothetical protein
MSRVQIPVIGTDLHLLGYKSCLLTSTLHSRGIKPMTINYGDTLSSFSDKNKTQLSYNTVGVSIGMRITLNAEMSSLCKSPLNLTCSERKQTFPVTSSNIKK